MGSVHIWCLCKAIWRQDTKQRSSPWEATLSLPQEVIYMWPNWWFFSKDLWFDLLSGFSFLTIFWPLLPSKSTQQEKKECISIYPLHIGPIHCPISSLSIQSSISEPERSGLLTLIKWFSKGLKSPAAAKSLQSCPTLCDPIDGSPPGSPVPGILQARILEWVAISFSNPLLKVLTKL